MLRRRPPRSHLFVSERLAVHVVIPSSSACVCVFVCVFPAAVGGFVWILRLMWRPAVVLLPLSFIASRLSSTFINPARVLSFGNERSPPAFRALYSSQ